jgi:hydrophobe/amphiphile efflux-1 (HAE1) family protein
MTIAVSTIISAFNSLTLSPALTALLLRKHDKHSAPPLPWLAFPLLGGWLGWLLVADRLAPMVDRLATFGPWGAPVLAAVLGAIVGGLLGRWLNLALGAFFQLFNRVFLWMTRGYTRAVGGLVRVSLLVLVVYGGLLGLTWWRFVVTPKGFIPAQDMGYLMVSVQLPDSASMERTQAVIDRIVQIAIQHPAVKHCSGITGQSFVLNAFGSNFGSMFVNLKDYHLRRDASLSSEKTANDLRAAFGRNIKEASVQVFPPPPIRGVGRAGGFMIMIEDRGDLGPHLLQQETERLVALGSKVPGLMMLSSPFRANVPQLYVRRSGRQSVLRKVASQDYANTLRMYQGSLYVNDFNKFGRTWQVIIQSEPEFRDKPEYISRLKVRNAEGMMVPLGSIATVQEVNGPLVLTRYNMRPAASINGMAAPGTSSHRAIEIMEHLAHENLPRNMSFEWTDMSYLELLAGNTATVIFGFAVVMVFLVLAAQYESWSLPLAVILVVPMCLLSALIGVSIARMDVNIFTRIGFVVLVGLASKNAILIVEFAKQQRAAGVPRREATLAACGLRLRPIVMTSLAFILGVVPLIASHGAGAEMRRALGVAVFSGMLGVTLFGLALTPVFFYTIDKLGETRLLSSRRWRQTSELMLGVLRLRPLRWAAMAALRRAPRPTSEMAGLKASTASHETLSHAADGAPTDLSDPAAAVTAPPPHIAPAGRTPV